VSLGPHPPPFYFLVQSFIVVEASSCPLPSLFWLSLTPHRSQSNHTEVQLQPSILSVQNFQLLSTTATIETTWLSITFKAVYSVPSYFSNHKSYICSLRYPSQLLFERLSEASIILSRLYSLGYFYSSGLRYQLSYHSFFHICLGYHINELSTVVFLT
jgi:hypothetical protein